MNNPWQLVTSGRYAEAVAAYTLAIDTKPTPLDYNNRATARVLLGDLDGALSDYAISGYLDQSRATRGDHSLIHVAAVFWLQGRTSQAHGLWQYTVEEMSKGRFTHTDAAGGVQCGALLWFCAAALDDDDSLLLAERLLMKLAKKPGARSWPGPIAPFLLGELPENEMLSAVSATPILRERQLCQAHFYAASSYRHAADRAGWSKHMALAAGLEPALLEVELALAKHEIGNPSWLHAGARGENHFGEL